MYQQPPPSNWSEPEPAPPAVVPATPGAYTERRVVRSARPGLAVANLVYLIFALIEGLIGLRVVMKLLSADSAAPFARSLYAITEPLVAPFQGLFPNAQLAGLGRLEVDSLFAIVVYALIGWVLAKLAAIAFGRSTSVSSVDAVDNRPYGQP